MVDLSSRRSVIKQSASLHLDRTDSGDYQFPDSPSLADDIDSNLPVNEANTSKLVNAFV